VLDERGVRVAQVRADDLRLLLGEFEQQRVRQPSERGLGDRVGTGTGEPAQHRVDIDDGTAAIGRQHRRERSHQQQRPEDVGLAGRPDLLDRRGQQLAQSAGGAGDEDGAVGEVHGLFLITSGN
jgi:hypothetical protein